MPHGEISEHDGPFGNGARTVWPVRREPPGSPDYEPLPFTPPEPPSPATLAHIAAIGGTLERPRVRLIPNGAKIVWSI